MRPSLRHGLMAFAFLATYGFTHAIAPVAPPVPPAIAALPMTLVPWSGVEAPPLAPEIAKVLAADEYVRRYYYAGSPANRREGWRWTSPITRSPASARTCTRR